ncbi:MAG: hypothetical protein ACRCZZ_08845, partial [Phocaeicola sp.]
NTKRLLSIPDQKYTPLFHSAGKIDDFFNDLCSFVEVKGLPVSTFLKTFAKMTQSYTGTNPTAVIFTRLFQNLKYDTTNDASKLFDYIMNTIKDHSLTQQALSGLLNSLSGTLDENRLSKSLAKLQVDVDLSSYQKVRCVFGEKSRAIFDKSGFSLDFVAELLKHTTNRTLTEDGCVALLGEPFKNCFAMPKGFMDLLSAALGQNKAPFSPVNEFLVSVKSLSLADFCTLLSVVSHSEKFTPPNFTTYLKKVTNTTTVKESLKPIYLESFPDDCLSKDTLSLLNSLFLVKNGDAHLVASLLSLAKTKKLDYDEVDAFLTFIQGAGANMLDYKQLCDSSQNDILIKNYSKISNSLLAVLKKSDFISLLYQLTYAKRKLQMSECIDLINRSSGCLSTQHPQLFAAIVYKLHDTLIKNPSYLNDISNFLFPKTACYASISTPEMYGITPLFIDNNELISILVDIYKSIYSMEAIFHSLFLHPDSTLINQFIAKIFKDPNLIKYLELPETRLALLTSNAITRLTCHELSPHITHMSNNVSTNTNIAITRADFSKFTLGSVSSLDATIRSITDNILKVYSQYNITHELVTSLLTILNKDVHVEFFKVFFAAMEAKGYIPFNGDDSQIIVDAFAKIHPDINTLTELLLSFSKSMNTLSASHKYALPTYDHVKNCLYDMDINKDTVIVQQAHYCWKQLGM